MNKKNIYILNSFHFFPRKTGNKRRFMFQRITRRDIAMCNWLQVCIGAY